MTFHHAKSAPRQKPGSEYFSPGFHSRSHLNMQNRQKELADCQQSRAGLSLWWSLLWELEPVLFLGRDVSPGDKFFTLRSSHKWVIIKIIRTHFSTRCVKQLLLNKPSVCLPLQDLVYSVFTAVVPWIQLIKGVLTRTLFANEICLLLFVYLLMI